MSAITNFLSVNAAADDLLPPDTARTLNGILESLERQADLPAHQAILASFLAHVARADNPHRVTKIEHAYVDSLPLIYAQYAAGATAPMSRTLFDSAVAASPLRLIELMRRLVVNQLGQMDRFSAATTPASLDYLAPIPDAPSPGFAASVAFPGATVAGVAQTLPAGALGYPAGTAMLRVRLAASAAADQPLLVLSNATERLQLTRLAGTSRLVAATLVNDEGAIATPSVLMDAYLGHYQNTYADLGTGALALDLALADPATPSVTEKIELFLQTYLQQVPTSVIDSLGSVIMDFPYDPHRRALAEDATATALAPTDAEEDLPSLPPLGVVDQEAFVCVTYSPAELRLYYLHDGQLRSVMAYTYGFAHPLEQLLVGMAFSDAASDDRLRAVRLYPGELSPAQILDLLPTL